MQATRIIRRVDDLGRIAIPKEIRKQLKIEECDRLEFFTTGKREIILKPCRPSYTLQKDEDWEVLEDAQGKVLIEGHRLRAEEVLSAMGVEFQIEEIEEN